MKQHDRTLYWRRGEPLVWLTAAALALTLLATLTLIGVVLVNGLGTYWPKSLQRFELTDGRTLMGQVMDEERRVVSRVTEEGGELVPVEVERALVKVGNRDLYGRDFIWVERAEVAAQDRPAGALVLERLEHGDFMGFLRGLEPAGLAGPEAGREPAELLRAAMQQGGGRALLVDAGGREHGVELSQIVRAYQPNTMNVGDKLAFYGGKLVELLTTGPREANTEGGLAPAIFGTVALVLLMSLFSIPLGVVAAIYLREYARQGLLVRLVRIGVNNLAGVPSIVYGIFGLGFFVYIVGGTIDQVFYDERLPSPTFGTGGLLWASLTLALLTLPVVIVATEESLAAVPRGIREGSLALGATRFQTLVRILLPMASPGIMTGFILAMARAAGEVAPLMLVGVVKLAPALPVDGEFPFVHLDRKFMHLGFHIFDVGFQSPNVEAAKPMVYVTTLLLLTIVILLSATAIWLRGRMRKKYATGAF